MFVTGLSIRARATLALACCLGFTLACETTQKLKPYPPFIDLPRSSAIGSIPVILVGQVIKTMKVGSPQTDPWGRTHSLQLHKAAVKVENVLRGKVQPGDIDLYYFRDLQPVGMLQLGTVPDSGSWNEGDREMFFLQSDSGRLRTVCDTYAHCVLPVYSGHHDLLQANANVWIGNTITDILLARGQDTSDQQMAKAIGKSSGPCYEFSPAYTVDKLKQFVRTGSAPIRHEACVALANVEGSWFDKDPQLEHIRSLCRL